MSDFPYTENRTGLPPSRGDARYLAWVLGIMLLFFGLAVALTRVTSSTDPEYFQGESSHRVP